MRGKKLDEDLQAKVIASLMAGSTVTEVAKALDLPHTTVSEYRKTIPEDVFVEIRRKKGERLDDLVYQCLIRNLETMAQQSEIVSEREYVIKQPAGELATLYGVMADKTIRLLAATTNAGFAEPRQLEAGP